MTTERVELEAPSADVASEIEVLWLFHGLFSHVLVVGEVSSSVQILILSL